MVQQRRPLVRETDALSSDHTFRKDRSNSIRPQPKKVWRHFHDPSEHWERLVGQDLARLRAEADEVVGARRHDQEELLALSGRVKRRAHEVLCRHHDEHYGPIYLAELSSL